MSDHVPEIDIDNTTLEKYWVWFAVGIIIATAIMFLYHLNRYLDNWVEENKPYEIVTGIERDTSRDEIPSGEQPSHPPITPIDEQTPINP